MAQVNDTMDSSPSYLPLSEDESRILGLYDKLQELHLESAILKAQRRQPNETEEPSPEEVESARHEMLEARGKYMLRNQVIESVMIANPTLKAVHSGKDASLVESDLLPVVEERDEIGTSVAKHSAELATIRSEATRVQSDTITAARNNVTLAAQVLDLAAQIKAKKSGRPDDEAVLRELDKLERDVKRSNQRWKIIKGVTSGVVVGSGVDWARDEHLCGLVLDPEEEP